VLRYVLLWYIKLRKAVALTSLFFYAELVVFLCCVYDLLMICLVGCDDKNFGDTLYSETDGKMEVGRNFQG